jgi:hypothetical protein
MIPLGWELGTGDAVLIPLKHLAVCGQTQEAGKTTALEALISRADRRALTFITKRGEGSFAGGHLVPPFLRQHADWQSVAAILEASRGEKLKFERAWIIRASKGARTLGDVHRNVRRLMLASKGLSADVYLTLDAYLSIVVPQIDQWRWADRLVLTSGLNVMDLTSASVELQHLVIRSALDWVLASETDIVVVIPEAWKFIPEGRNTPVKLTAEAYIRQGAASGNFLWIDSQDLGGISKTILRSVPVWLLGVQREANEIKRTLANIPANVAKPKASEIATLGLGQFIACWGKHARRTYVQPVWAHDDEAQAVATGVLTVEDLQQRGGHVRDDERATLQAELTQLRRENADLRTEIARMVGARDREPPPGDRRSAEAARPPADARDGNPPARRLTERESPAAHPGPDDAFVDGALAAFDQFYGRIKARLIADLPSDPRVMEIVLARPELRVKVERHVITVDGETLRGRLARLLADGYFNEAQTTSTAMQELSRRGFNTAPPNVAKELGELARMGFLTRDNKWYRAVAEMRVNIVEAA